MANLLQRLKDNFLGGTPPAGEPMSGEAAPENGTAAEAPVSLQHAWSPEPDALKLRVSRMILPLGERRSYPDAAAAAESPLAVVLFALPGVAAVELDATSVQVTMAEDADWDGLMEQVPEAVKAHLDSGGTVVKGLRAEAEKKHKFGFRQLSEDERTPQEQQEIVQRLLDDEINPAVAAHGGYFSLIAVEENKVYVQLGGGCQGCGMVDVTLRQGVEQRMKEVLPEMIELIDVTDHRSGDNPYYTPGK